MVKLTGWMASLLSLSGIILNAYHIIWCWLIWSIANIFWIYWSVRKKEWAQTVLWVSFTLANIYGWYLWNNA